ncbi:hypothetical protein [Nocardioides sp. SR21]|uniref:hypothetical protein n=1 Tax=Nocardioides sp. SR21 TaxID=2919501 RepID=UPI001FAA3428|nr:hypothetical protein [Nocardioides sp. SR21]
MTGSRRSLASLAVLALLAAPLTACGSDGEISLPTPTGSVTFSPTRTPSLPSLPTRTPSESPSETPSETPPPSETPSEAPSETPSETPSESPTPTPTPRPTRTPTETVTVTESPTPSETPTETPTGTPTEPPTETPSETATPTPSESPSPSEEPEADETSSDVEEDPAPAWVYWLFGLVLLAAAIGIPLYLWTKRRNRWRDDLGAAEADLVWLARTHLPELRLKADSPDRVTGGWEVAGEGRASAAEDHLTALEASAPNDYAAAQARTLRDAVRAARGRLAALDGATDAASVTATLDAAIADLEAALRPPAQA